METKVINTYKDVFAEYLLCLALDVGEGMLKNGGEVSRVEDTIERICYSYGASHVEVFTIVSVIHASIRMEDGTYSSQMRRVRTTSMNLARLEQFNAISRKVCSEKPALAVFDGYVQDVKLTKGYPVWLQLLAWAVAAGAFAVFYGGALFDTLAAMFAGCVMFCVEHYSSKRINGIAKTVFSSLLASLIAGAFVLLGIGQDGGAIVMGTIMLLVPGMAIGTAVRDLFCGDILSGSMKLLQACLTALMIAFGYILAATILGGGVI
ncbi:MAG: threonine/serine exporter family protein [Clostridia bacterium]|nr:threonine/serine exporter family protein [Clostridia bacterium]